MISELHPYTAYKPSGVSWIDDVPAHWEMRPGRAVFQEVIERDNPDEQLLSVTIVRGVIAQETLLQDSSQKDSSRLDKSDYKLVCPGDIVYNKMRAWQGAVGVSTLRGIVSPAYVVQRPRCGSEPLYFHHLMRLRAFATEAERWSYGIASDMWSLRPEHFKMIHFPLPPLDEQCAIVRYLDYVDGPHPTIRGRQGEAHRPAGGGAAGGYQPRRHSRPRLQRPPQALRHRLARRHPRPLGSDVAKAYRQTQKWGWISDRRTRPNGPGDTILQGF